MPRLSYDGSWKGFLTLLAKSEIMEPEDCKDLAIHRQGRNGDLFSEAGDFVATLERDARRIHDCLGKKLGARAAWVMSRAQAAEREDVDRLLLLLWRFPDRLDRDERLGLREWAERVATECHRYQGILRFSLLMSESCMRLFAPALPFCPFLPPGRPSDFLKHLCFFMTGGAIFFAGRFPLQRWAPESREGLRVRGLLIRPVGYSSYCLQNRSLRPFPLEGIVCRSVGAAMYMLRQLRNAATATCNAPFAEGLS